MSEKDTGQPPRPRWIGGAILIFLGVVFLLQNVGLMSRDGLIGVSLLLGRRDTA